MKKTISVIMPVYNAEKYLADAVESVLAQTFSDFELILVDDGSEDGSPSICDSYAEKDTRVVVLHKPNGGICDARNAGLKIAKGDYVGFMDNDDYLEPNALMDNHRLAVENDADWVKFGKTEILMQGDNILAEKPTHFEQAVYDHEALMRNFMKLRVASAMTFVWDSLLRRSIIEEHGLAFNTAFKHGNEDIDFCEIFAGYCGKMVVNPTCYYKHYTRLGLSASSKYAEAVIPLHIYLLERSNARYRKYGIDGVQTDRDYANIVTRQLIVSSCQKLNDAGKLLTGQEKRRILRSVHEDPAMERYIHCNTALLKGVSVKLYLYSMLFQKRYFRLLLLGDKLSRKLVYWIRSLGV